MQSKHDFFKLKKSAKRKRTTDGNKLGLKIEPTVSWLISNQIMFAGKSCANIEETLSKRAYHKVATVWFNLYHNLYHTGGHRARHLRERLHACVR